MLPNLHIHHNNFVLQVRRVGEAKDNMGFEHIMALNKNGVSFLDQITHETLIHYPFTEVGFV